MSRVEWSREAVVALIEVYKRYPCLWDSKHIDYKNNDKRKEAVSEMTEAVKLYHPEVSAEDCRTKYQNLRGQFSKEYAKLLVAKEESGADDLPKSKFWCFYKLIFLKDSIRPKTTKYEVRYKDTSSISNKADNGFDKNCTYKMENLVDNNESHFDGNSYNVEYLDNNYFEYEENEAEKSKKRKLEEQVPAEHKVKIEETMQNSLSEIPSTEVEINVKQNNEPQNINKNTKLGELLTQTLNECHNKEKRKWAQKEVLNIITSLVDVDSDGLE